MVWIQEIHAIYHKPLCFYSLQLQQQTCEYIFPIEKAPCDLLFHEEQGSDKAPTWIQPLWDSQHALNCWIWVTPPKTTVSLRLPCTQRFNRLIDQIMLTSIAPLCSGFDPQKSSAKFWAQQKWLVRLGHIWRFRISCYRKFFQADFH